MVKIVRLIALWSMRIILKKLENTKSTLDDKVVVSIYSDAIEWILINGNTFRRYFIMEQITVY